MSKQKKVVLSEKNIDLLVDLAESLGSAEEVRKDPNFALSLLFNSLKKRPSGTVMGALLDSLDPDSIEYAREEIDRNKAA